MKRARAAPPPAIAIAHRDAHLLVLIKPPGLPTTAPDAHTDCLARRARELDPDAPKMHPSSRLDRDVTGLVTFARTTLGIDALLAARREGRYHRTYLALVAGALETTTGAWDWSIAIAPRDRRLRRAIDPGDAGERAQVARSRWEQRATVGAASVLALHPETGRTHQLRVHCARAGHAILGDASYGGAPRVVLADGRVIAARRPMLHCGRLVLPDVEHGGELDLRAEAPDDLMRTWIGLGGDPAALTLAREESGR